MRVLRGSFDWNEGYNNDVTLRLLVDRVPCVGEVEHRLVPTPGGGTLVLGELDGYVHFFHHSPRDESGYGGAEFTVRTAEGARSFRGPWSARAGFANTVSGARCVDVSLTEEPAAFERGFTFLAGSVTVDAVLVAMRAGLVDCGRSYADRELMSRRVRSGREWHFPVGARPCLLLAHDRDDVRFDPGVLYPDGRAWAKDTRDRALRPWDEVLAWSGWRPDPGQDEKGQRPGRLYREVIT